MNWEGANVLTLGYREVTPGAAGHRVTQSNAIMCYYPNTLVAALKKPLWGSLHQLMGDDLMTHLLLNYTIIVQIQGAPGSYMQVFAYWGRRRDFCTMLTMYVLLLLVSSLEKVCVSRIK